MIITIDGPAGTGKSTVARALADRLGYTFLDTGALYRAVAWKCLQDKIEFEEVSSIVLMTAKMNLKWEQTCLWVDDQDVTQQIRTEAVSLGASKVAVIPEVRKALDELQRKVAENNNVVTEGRDQGTVVFPQAECKFYLEATAEERARRRLYQMTNNGEQAEYDTILEQIKDRDERDATRKIAPLKPAEDAIVLDSTELTPDRVLEQLEILARERVEKGRE